MAEQQVSDVTIANYALQKLGAERIESFEQNRPNARSINAAYYITRDKCLRKHAWNFAIKRASLAADSDVTTYGDLNRFTLPNDFIRLLRKQDAGSGSQNQLQNWQREGGFIVTSDDAPLEFRYIAKVTNPALYDPLFIDWFTTILALQLCEEVTQSTAKKESLKDDARGILQEAALTNAIENEAEDPPEDDWLQAYL